MFLGTSPAPVTTLDSHTDGSNVRKAGVSMRGCAGVRGYPCIPGKPHHGLPCRLTCSVGPPIFL